MKLPEDDDDRHFLEPIDSFSVEKKEQDRTR